MHIANIDPPPHREVIASLRRELDCVRDEADRLRHEIAIIERDARAPFRPIVQRDVAGDLIRDPRRVGAIVEYMGRPGLVVHCNFDECQVLIPPPRGSLSTLFELWHTKGEIITFTTRSPAELAEAFFPSRPSV